MPLSMALPPDGSAGTDGACDSNSCSSCDFIHKVNRPDDCIGIAGLNPAHQSQSEEMVKEVAWNLVPKELHILFYYNGQGLINKHFN